MMSSIVFDSIHPEISMSCEGYVLNMINVTSMRDFRFQWILSVTFRIHAFTILKMAAIMFKHKYSIMMSFAVSFMSVI